MEIMIYEDQTGFMQFPEKRSIKDSKIVSFFNNNVDLYIEKIGNNLTIYCHLIAFKASTRPTGYYIIYKDIYNDEIFSNLKRDIDNLLKKLEFKSKTGHKDNLIFENITMFDSASGSSYKEDTHVLIEAMKNGRNLEYSAGDIKDISDFCKNILKKNPNNIKISIASTKNALGNINILLNKKGTESLKKIGDTEQTINEYRERIREREKEARGLPGKTKIRSAFEQIREGADILRNVGYNNLEIRNEIDRNKEEIFAKFPVYTKERDPINIEKIPNKIDDDKDNYIEINFRTVAVICLVILLTASAIYLVMFPDVRKKIMIDVGIIKEIKEPIIDSINNSSNLTVNVTPIPTNIPMPVLLKIKTLTPTNETINVTFGNVITFNITTNQFANITWYFNNNKVQSDYNNISIYNNTNATIGKGNISVIVENINGTITQNWSLNIQPKLSK